MDRRLNNYQGINYNYSQLIIDNVAEAVAGMNTSNAVKIYGDNLDQLDELANQVFDAIKDVPGIKHVGILRNVGQPELSVLLDKEKMAFYNITKADAQALIEMAIGGKTATQKYEGERKFDIRIRYNREHRSSEEDILLLRIPTLTRATSFPSRKLPPFARSLARLSSTATIPSASSASSFRCASATWAVLLPRHSAR